MKQKIMVLLLSTLVALLAACSNGSGNDGSGNDGSGSQDTQVNTSPVIDAAFEDVNVYAYRGAKQYELNVSDSDQDALTLTVESNDTSVVTVTQNWTNPLLLADYNEQTLDFNLTAAQHIYKATKITITLSDGENNTTTSFNVRTFKPYKKTGQKKSYGFWIIVTDGSVKDDGYYQKGVESVFTRDDVTEIVTDHLTGLEWEDPVGLFDRSLSVYEAVDFCKALELDGGGWRMPTQLEMFSIVKTEIPEEQNPGIFTPRLDEIFHIEDVLTDVQNWSQVASWTYGGVVWEDFSLLRIHSAETIPYTSENRASVRCVRSCKTCN